MAKKITLKDKDDVTLYPQVSVDAVHDADGNTLEGFKIVNDLNTGGTNKALSAEMGVVVHTKLGNLLGLQPESFVYGYARYDGAIFSLDSSASARRTGRIDVKPGDVFLYSGQTDVWGYPIALYDKQGVYKGHLGEIGVTYDLQEMVIPNGVDIIVASSKKDTPFSLCKRMTLEYDTMFWQEQKNTDELTYPFSPDSMLTERTELVEEDEQAIGAGLWRLRYTTDENSVTKNSDGSFTITLDPASGTNPAFWMLNNPHAADMIGQTVSVEFNCNAEQPIHFLIGAVDNIIIPGDSFFHSNVEITNPYSDYRIMFYNSAQTAATFTVSNVRIEGITYQWLHSTLDDYDERITALENEQGGGGLRGKRLSILGDSVSTFGTPDQNNATGTWTYPNNFCRYPQANLLMDVNQCYWKRLIDRYNMSLGINDSWAGSKVSNTQPTDSGAQGPNRCISSQTRINHLGNGGTPDIILVYGGTNDAGLGVEIGTFNKENPKDYTSSQIANLPVATFADAYRAMLIRLLKTYPLSRIIVILPNFTSTYYSIEGLDNYIEMIKEECDFFGVKYVDIRMAGITIYNQSTYLGDGIHPNAAGMELLYKLLCRDAFDELDKYGL